MTFTEKTCLFTQIRYQQLGKMIPSKSILVNDELIVVVQRALDDSKTAALLKSHPSMGGNVCMFHFRGFFVLLACTYTAEIHFISAIV